MNPFCGSLAVILVSNNYILVASLLELPTEEELSWRNPVTRLTRCLSETESHQDADPTCHLTDEEREVAV